MTENERVHFKIALPQDLKRELEHKAVDNKRSLSAEMIHRLYQSLDAERVPSAPELPEDLRAQPVELSPEQLANLVKGLASSLGEQISQRFSLPGDHDPDQPTPSGGGGGNNWLPQGRFGPTRKMHQRDK